MVFTFLSSKERDQCLLLRAQYVLSLVAWRTMFRRCARGATRVCKEVWDRLTQKKISYCLFAFVCRLGNPQVGLFSGFFFFFLRQAIPDLFAHANNPKITST